MNLKELAKETGKIVMKHYASTDLKVEIKYDNSPVSNADLEANDYLIENLRQTGASILSEETGLLLQNPNDLYIIDPIDGTRGFTKKMGGFSVMISHIQNGKPIESIVYAPLENEMYHADEASTYLNNEPIHASNQSENISIAMNKSGIPNGFIMDFNVQTAKRYASLGVRLSKIADGTIDLWIPNKAKGAIWDLAAPAHILQNAGGRVITPNDTDFDFSYTNQITENPTANHGMDGLMICAFNANNNLEEKVRGYLTDCPK